MKDKEMETAIKTLAVVPFLLISAILSMILWLVLMCSVLQALHADFILWTLFGAYVTFNILSTGLSHYVTKIAKDLE